jgi:ubiquinone/menaquinone biosynthesis C-methylase UbiE
MRNQKIDLFLSFCGILPRGAKLLDVGGGSGIDGEFLRLYSHFAQVVLVNLDTRSFGVRNGTSLRWVIANGCDLPFECGSFDWVFSNAVIEHVGDWDKQKKFADEIRRVATRGYFVTTPNKFFPIEPHTLLPVYQFMPPEAQRFFVRFSPGYMREPQQINLLSGQELRVLFPEACVRKIGLRVLPNTLVAMHRVHS